jgi:ubiquinone biosynthesis protein UbiJ
MFPSPLFLSPQRALADALTASAVAAINHLLADEAWARASLARHAGKIAVIDTGHLALRLRAAADGLLEAARPETVPNVTIHVKLADLPLIAQNRERAFSYVRIEGDAEFANTISQLSRGLRWEPEHDLERLFGPIGASRLAGGARSAFANASATGRRLAENLAEFLVEERPVLVKPDTVDAFGADVVRLRDDIERTAKRVARLEQLMNAPRSTSIPTTRPSGDPTLDS